LHEFAWRCRASVFLDVFARAIELHEALHDRVVVVALADEDLAGRVRDDVVCRTTRIGRFARPVAARLADASRIALD
jgi:hypothetical protein